MSTGTNPYEVPYAADDDDTGVGSPVLEFTIHAAMTPVNIGGVTVQAETFNGTIPGPTIRLNVNQTVVIRLVNDLRVPTGIHWHGIELANYADGTEVTQDGAARGTPPVQQLGGTPPAPGVAVPAGGTYLYKFSVPRAGLYWYHPHHHNSLNRVFKGLYGMIVVTDPAENSIVSTYAPIINRALPAAADTMQVVLSDITVCEAANDIRTYLDYLAPDNGTTDAAEWLALADTPTLTQQSGPQPVQLCEIGAGGATNDDGSDRTASHGDPWEVGTITNYGPGVVPSMMRSAGNNTVEGQTVLTNGMDVGGRKGKPDGPLGDPVAGIPTPRTVVAGQGLRLQIVNCASLRYFRLRMTWRDAANVTHKIDLVRVGGEGGLLDNAILEGGTGPNRTITVGANTWTADYDSGEILLPPATRADVVAAIPLNVPNNAVITLWTRDFKRVGRTGGSPPFGPRANWAQLPTVPVAHFQVSGARAAGTEYTISGGNLTTDPVVGTSLRAAAGIPTNASQDLRPPPLGFGPATPATLLAGTAAPAVAADIKLKANGAEPTVDDVAGAFETDATHPTYAQLAHPGSARFAESNQVYQLTVTNTTNAHHPFHLHGFSFQPIRFDQEPGTPAAGKVFVFPYREFRDTIDLPPHSMLTFRVRTGPRPLADGTTAGGELGRWLFHCHIFFHHHLGMISEFVVKSLDGTERPTINIGGTWEFKTPGNRATRKGSFYHPTPSHSVTAINATRGFITNFTAGPSGTFDWHYDVPAGDPPHSEYVYVTATDGVRQNQAVFRLQVGPTGTDTGSDWGDPHLVLPDGKRYDFQSAGEFTLLRDAEGMEIQVRQTPAETPPPVTDAYSGLTSCVSLNTAVAARVGRHTIAFQPANSLEGGHILFVDGERTSLRAPGLDFDGHRVTPLETGEDKPGMRIDYANGTVVLVTPHLWDSYGIRYLDVSVTNTQADEGVMGRIPKTSWLPKLRTGQTLGHRPTNPLERYVQLYRTFADSWRVTDATSMFVYAPGTSTATFTDVDWPPPPSYKREVAVHPRCVLKPNFQKPLKPIERNIDVAEARRICHLVTDPHLHEMCVFDVVTTGDPSFARGYLTGQNLRKHSTKIQIHGDKDETEPGQPLLLTAIVQALYKGPSPTGHVHFIVDGVEIQPAVPLDAHGRGTLTMSNLALGLHKIRAQYHPEKEYLRSASGNLLHRVVARAPGTTPGSSDSCERLAKYIRTYCPELAKQLAACIEHLMPCSCGGAHSQADHPTAGHDDNAPAAPTGGSHHH